MARTFTLSELVEMTGLKPRTIQFWTANGVIRPDPTTEYGGPGVPRRYPVHEVAICLVLRELSRLPLQIGGFRQAAAKLREIFRYGEETGFSTAEELDRAIDARMRRYNNEMNAYIEKHGRQPLVEYKEIEPLWTDNYRKLGRLLDYFQALEGEHNIILTLEVDDLGAWDVSMDPADAYNETRGGRPPAVWSLALNVHLTRILAPLRERLGADVESAVGDLEPSMTDSDREEGPGGRVERKASARALP